MGRKPFLTSESPLLPTSPSSLITFVASQMADGGAIAIPDADAATSVHCRRLCAHSRTYLHSKCPALAVMRVSTSPATRRLLAAPRSRACAAPRRLQLGRRAPASALEVARTAAFAAAFAARLAVERLRALARTRARRTLRSTPSARAARPATTSSLSAAASPPPRRLLAALYRLRAPACTFSRSRAFPRGAPRRRRLGRRAQRQRQVLRGCRGPSLEHLPPRRLDFGRARHCGQRGRSGPLLEHLLRRHGLGVSLGRPCVPAAVAPEHGLARALSPRRAGSSSAGVRRRRRRV
jgi:hypothetical protein